MWESESPTPNESAVFDSRLAAVPQHFDYEASDTVPASSYLTIALSCGVRSTENTILRRQRVGLEMEVSMVRTDECYPVGFSVV